MSWQGRYYYGKLRVNGRRQTVYLGRGETARLCAEVDAEAREEREAGWQARRDEKAELKAWGVTLEGVARRLRLVSRAALLAAGFYHHPSGWRRRGNTMTEKTQALVVRKPAGPLTGAELRALAARAQKGDHKALPALRAALDDGALAVDVEKNVRAALITKFLGAAALLWAEVLARRADALQAELLGGAEPTAVEKLLVDDVITCFIHLQALQLRHAHTEDTFTSGVFYQRCLTSAHHRYTNALKSLTRVQNLAAPALRLYAAEGEGKKRLA